MIKFIATDIDGTLLQNGERTVSQRFFSEARRLQEKGIVICAASGRQYYNLQRLFAPLADSMYFLCENGTLVYGPGKQMISRTLVERKTALELCHEIMAMPECEVLMSGTNVTYICPKSREYENIVHYFVGDNVKIVPSPEDVPEEFIKVSACYMKGAVTIEPILRPRWKDRFQIAIAGDPWLDFTMADKGSGLHALLEHLQIDPSEAMAFGDNYNDVPMLNAVGHSYIMSSAAAALRERYPMQCGRPEDVLEIL